MQRRCVKGAFLQQVGRAPAPPTPGTRPAQASAGNPGAVVPFTPLFAAREPAGAVVIGGSGPGAACGPVPCPQSGDHGPAPAPSAAEQARPGRHSPATRALGLGRGGARTGRPPPEVAAARPTHWNPRHTERGPHHAVISTTPPPPNGTVDRGLPSPAKPAAERPERLLAGPDPGVSRAGTEVAMRGPPRVSRRRTGPPDLRSPPLGADPGANRFSSAARP
jgi:hypothetical protein